MNYDLSGIWDSNIGFVYEFFGKGDVYHWKVIGGTVELQGRVTVKTSTRTFHEWGPTDSGYTYSCWNTITGFDSHGNPIRIDGENGVIFFRRTGA